MSEYQLLQEAAANTKSAFCMFRRHLQTCWNYLLTTKKVEEDHQEFYEKFYCQYKERIRTYLYSSLHLVFIMWLLSSVSDLFLLCSDLMCVCSPVLSLHPNAALASRNDRIRSMSVSIFEATSFHKVLLQCILVLSAMADLRRWYRYNQTAFIQYCMNYCILHAVKVSILSGHHLES